MWLQNRLHEVNANTFTRGSLRNINKLSRTKDYPSDPSSSSTFEWGIHKKKATLLDSLFFLCINRSC